VVKIGGHRDKRHVVIVQVCSGGEKVHEMARNFVPAFVTGVQIAIDQATARSCSGYGAASLASPPGKQ